MPNPPRKSSYTGSRSDPNHISASFLMVRKILATAGRTEFLMTTTLHKIALAVRTIDIAERRGLIIRFQVKFAATIRIKHEAQRYFGLSVKFSDDFYTHWNRSSRQSAIFSPLLWQSNPQVHANYISIYLVAVL